MLNALLKKTEDLIKWWKLELGIILTSLSILFLILKEKTNSETPYSKLLDLEKINQDKYILIITLTIIIALIFLMIVSLFKGFRTILTFNSVLNEISGKKAKDIVQRSKTLLSIILTLIAFPWIIVIPKISVIFAFAIMICKFLFWKNNKEIQDLAENETNKELKNSNLAQI